MRLADGLGLGVREGRSEVRSEPFDLSYRKDGACRQPTWEGRGEAGSGAPECIFGGDGNEVPVGHARRLLGFRREATWMTACRAGDQRMGVSEDGDLGRPADLAPGH